MPDCNLCGNTFGATGITNHYRKCVLKYKSSELTSCRFCNEECSKDYVFIHEESCDFIREFSPYLHEDVFNYYKHIFNFDPNDKESTSKCRHCSKPIKDKYIFKHEENCLKQLDRFIGPQPERIKCCYCQVMFYKNKYEQPIIYDGRPTIKIHEGLDEHKIKCRPKHTRPKDPNREVIDLRAIRREKKLKLIEEIAATINA